MFETSVMVAVVELNNGFLSDQSYDKPLCQTAIAIHNIDAKALLIFCICSSDKTLSWQTHLCCQIERMISKAMTTDTSLKNFIPKSSSLTSS
ncbi:hypothetical protein JYQ62_09505 [Nostoc sp. UHCC 0702]|nr:hypothetical protein JYQ62_09505 [Nostoc sp. UHCC 0702]